MADKKMGGCGEKSPRMPKSKVKNVHGPNKITKATNKTTKQKGNG